MKSDPTSAFRWAALMFAALVLIQPYGQAQSAAETPSAPSDPAGALRDLQEQVRQLRGMVDEMRAENAQSRAEMRQLRDDLQTTRALLQPAATPAGTAPQAAAEDQVAATAAAPTF